MVKEPKLDDDGNPIVDDDDPPVDNDLDDDLENPKKEPFNPKEFANGWTITDRKSKNLLTLFTNMRGINNQTEVKEAELYACKTNAETVTASLDDFCTRITEEVTSRNLYMQVLFTE